MTTNHNSCFVCTTFFSAKSSVDQARAGAALRGAQVLQDFGIKLIVVDAGSDTSFLHELEKFDAQIFPQTGKTLGSARRQAFSLGQASGAEILIYSELEKDTFCQSLPPLIDSLANSSARLMVPARHNMLSYPLFQRRSEELINAYFKSLTGVELDSAFGPRLWKLAINNLFLDFDGAYGDKWDSIFIPVLRAVYAGETILSPTVFYENPAEQTAAENFNSSMEEKRIEQLYSITQGFKLDWQELQKKAPSGLATSKAQGA